MRIISSSTPSKIGAVAIAYILFAALPELLLINLELWSVIAAATWAVGGLLGATALAFAITGVLFGALGAYSTGATLVMAIRNHPEPPDKI